MSPFPQGADAGIELVVADAFIYETLSTNAALEAVIGNDSIYPEQAPAGVPFPFVVYSVQAPGPDFRATGSVRQVVRPLYLVRAYAETRSWFGNLWRAASLLDRALHRAPGGPVDVLDPESGEHVIGYVDGIWREEPFRQKETHGEEEWRAMGGIYRVVVRAGD